MTKIISLGGSIIVPDAIDTEFLKRFRDLILSHDDKFAIYCGGGSIARKYQKALAEVVGEDKDKLDWMGISATHLNAFLIRSIFKDVAEDEIIKDPTLKIKFDKKVLVAGGWKPGWSTDYDSVLLAKNIGADTVINLTNVDHIYDKDPRKFKDAKAIKELSWDNLLLLIGEDWKPGLNAPFDPIAAKKARELGIKAYVVGKDIDNLKNVLSGKEFVGTKIR
ncbi:MAG: UMP kinase [Nanoarchaeota archaeon]|nr:UMP kinase [Nanoarchaeota archaeon]MBU1704019.1 UMP kinase [Nanoarchaeota archaeon]